MARGLVRRLVLMFVAMSVIGCMGVCFTGPLWLTRTGSTVWEWLPTEDDARLARELNEASEDAGRETDITAQEIANLRRMGQMDEVDAAVDHVLDGRWHANEETPAPTKPRRDPTAYYPTAPPEERAGGPWLEIALALTAGFMFLAACGAAYLALATSGTEETPWHTGGPGGGEPPIS